MNYRHAFHAGNFADVVKHALLVALLRALRAGTSPLLVLDTHAGAGLYALDGAEARRAGEWPHGIGRLDPAAPPAPLADYAAIVAAAGYPRQYPGSPWIARHLLRPGDRLIACESEAEPARLLAQALAGDPRVQVRTGDGWRALRTFLPPRERRGLVLIDPPFERPDEYGRLGRALAAAQRQWPGGTLAAWYPLKYGAAVDQLFRAASPSTLAFELLISAGAPGGRLHGSGLALVNPPPDFDAAAAAILDALVPLLATGPGAGWRRRGESRPAPVSSSGNEQGEVRRERSGNEQATRSRPPADGRKSRPRLPRQA